jgi:hypothetical protein
MLLEIFLACRAAIIYFIYNCFDYYLCLLFSIGLSRERVRQVGLVALEKLKHAARKRKMEAMLVNH